MYIDLIKLPSPPIAGGVWLDGAPPTPEALEGKVVLVDFFDITSVAYLAALPYLFEWHRKYEPFGVRVLGVHCPSYEFARDPAVVESAVRRLEVPYPVGIDVDGALQKAFGIQSVPSRYVRDIQGFLRFYEIGDGDYGQIELFIHQAVRERDIRAELPDLMPPIRKEDRTGGFTLPVSREIRADEHVGNADPTAGGTVEHALPEERADGSAYLEGPWRRDGEAFVLEGAGAVRVPYRAAEVFVVAACPEETEVSVSVDGQPIGDAERGLNVHLADGGGTAIDIHSPRPYQLILHEEVEAHELEISSAGPGLAFFGVQFVSRMPAGI